MAITQNHVINIQPGVSAPLVIHCSQGDTGTQINLTVVNGDEEFDCSSYACSVHGVRSDGGNWGPITCTVSGSTVGFSLTSAMTAVAGACLAEISVGTVGTANFAMLMENATFENGVTYSNDVSVYQSILTAVQNGLTTEKSERVASVTNEKNERIAAVTNEKNERIAAVTNEKNERIAAVTNEKSERVNVDDSLSNRISQTDARINNLVANTGNSNSEIVDARTDSNGKVYKTLGEAIRTTDNALRSRTNGRYWIRNGSYANSGNTSAVTAGPFQIDFTDENYNIIVDVDRPLDAGAVRYAFGIAFLKRNIESVSYDSDVIAFIDPNVYSKEKTKICNENVDLLKVTNANNLKLAKYICVYLFQQTESDDNIPLRVEDFNNYHITVHKVYPGLSKGADGKVYSNPGEAINTIDLENRNRKVRAYLTENDIFKFQFNTPPYSCLFHLDRAIAFVKENSSSVLATVTFADLLSQVGDDYKKTIDGIDYCLVNNTNTLWFNLSTKKFSIEKNKTPEWDDIPVLKSWNDQMFGGILLERYLADYFLQYAKYNAENNADNYTIVNGTFNNAYNEEAITAGPFYIDNTYLKWELLIDRPTTDSNGKYSIGYAFISSLSKINSDFTIADSNALKKFNFRASTASDAVFANVFNAIEVPNEARYVVFTIAEYDSSGNAIAIRKKDFKGTNIRLLKYNITGKIITEKVNNNVVSRNSEMLSSVYAAGSYYINGNGKENNSDVFKRNVSFLVVEDVHRTVTAMENAIEYLNAIESLDFGICVGDMAGGDYSETDGSWYTNLVNKSKKKFYTVLGNHDVGNSKDASLAATPKQAFEKFIKPTLTVMGMPDLAVPYYSFDTDYGVTFIVLNNYDGPETKDSDGNFTYLTGWEMISQTQINWLLSALDSVPTDNTLVIFMHSFPYNNEKIDCSFSQSNITKLSGNGNALYTDLVPDIVNAWKNGTSLKKVYSPIYDGFNSVSIDHDFSSRGTGKFACYIVGHSHMDCVCHSATYPDQILCGFVCTANDNWQTSWSDLPRAKTGKTFDAFTIVGIDTQRKMIKLVRIGSNMPITMEKRDVLAIPYE